MNWGENIRAIFFQYPVLLHSLYRSCHESSHLGIICLTSYFHLVFFPFPFHIPLGQGPSLILFTGVFPGKCPGLRESEKGAVAVCCAIASHDHQGRLPRETSD